VAPAEAAGVTVAHEKPPLVMAASGIPPLSLVKVPPGRRHPWWVAPLLAPSARRAGLEQIPCWVVELDDDAAFMLLVTCNAQGELRPLEIELHVLKAVSESDGGRGKNGGLRAYAAMVGKTDTYIRQLRDGAEVYKTAKLTPQFLDLGQHLSAIHKADRQAWPLLANYLLSQGWTVDETANWVKQVQKFELPVRGQLPVDLLPYEMVIG
jgi:hypothetical protein